MVSTGKTRPKGRPSIAPTASSVRVRPGLGRPARAFRTEHVIGRVALATRVAGGLALAAAICLAVRPFLPVGTAHGHAVGRSAGVLGLVGWLPAVALLAGAGVACATGRMPRLWLAVVASAGALSVGFGLRWIWLLDTGQRTVLDLPVGGQVLRGNTYSVGSGLVLGLAAAGLLVLALLAALSGWTGTVMEDGGEFDRWRPRFGAIGFFLGVAVAGSFSIAGAGSALGVGPPTVTQQSGLDRIGGLLLAAAVVVCCVAAAGLRPWLAMLGAWAGVAVLLFGAGVENALVVRRSPDLTASLGTTAQIVAPVVLLLLAAGGALLSAPRAEPEGMP